jgi:hypothetical protein
MKKLLFALMLMFLFQHIAYADKLKGKGKRFEQNKAWIVGQTNKKIGILKAFEGCVQSANSRQELKACRQTKKQEMEPLRAAGKERRAEREKRRAARKAKRQE